MPDHRACAQNDHTGGIMKISSRNQDPDLCIVDVGGRIDPAATPLFEQEMDRIISSSQYKLILNLKELNYIGSTGLRVFLTALKKVKAQNGTLVLCCMTPDLQRIFQIAGFVRLFDIVEKEEEALQKVSSRG